VSAYMCVCEREKCAGESVCMCACVCGRERVRERGIERVRESVCTETKLGECGYIPLPSHTH